MKKIYVLLIAAFTALLLTGCGTASAPQGGDICPGKQIGSEGVPMVRPEGFDETEDMSFTTVDTRGDPVTNDIFSGSERGVWLLFWQTGNEKSAQALAQLERLLPEAEENGYQIIGVVMDGRENPDAAAEMTSGLHFDNLVWNDEMALRYDGIMEFFDGTRWEEDPDAYANMDPQPSPGDPVSTRANERGQIQTSCTLVPLTDERIISQMQKFDSNMTYEELLEENENYLNR